MLALSLSDAKNIAIALVAAFAVASVASAWILKTIIQKVAVAALLALLAFGAWSQRVSLQECADDVRADYRRVGTDISVGDTECTFFGTFTITVSDPRTDDTAG